MLDLHYSYLAFQARSSELIIWEPEYAHSKSISVFVCSLQRVEGTGL